MNKTTRGQILFLGGKPGDRCCDGLEHEIIHTTDGAVFCSICSRKVIETDRLPTTGTADSPIHVQNFAIMDREMGTFLVARFLYTEDGCSASADGNHVLKDVADDCHDTGKVGDQAVCIQCGRKAETIRDCFQRRGLADKPIVYIQTTESSILEKYVADDNDCLEGYEHNLHGIGDDETRFADTAACRNCGRKAVLTDERSVS